MNRRSFITKTLAVLAALPFASKVAGAFGATYNTTLPYSQIAPSPNLEDRVRVSLAQGPNCYGQNVKMCSFSMIGGPYNGVIRPYPAMQTYDGIAIARIEVPCYMSGSASGEGYASYVNDKPYTLTYVGTQAADWQPLTLNYGYYAN